MSFIMSKPRSKLFCQFSLFLISFTTLLLLNTNFPRPHLIELIKPQDQSLAMLITSASEARLVPDWLEVIIYGTPLEHKNVLRVGLINFKDNEQSLLSLDGIAESVIINLDPVPPSVTWNRLFPGRTSENPSENCDVKLPMPEAKKYHGLDVVVAQLPCGDEDVIEGYSTTSSSNKSLDTKGAIRDVHRLQVSLATAHLIAENAIEKEDRDVYGVFISKCEPMVEMFRCDDLIWQEGDYWVYKPNVDKLREITTLPIGGCELANPYIPSPGSRKLKGMRQREAYVTVLHSSEAYVCGAIALAQSILRTNTTKDLVLLADHTISTRSITGLQAAGWKIKRIERIRSPYANISDYNAWNYSKLRVWQLVEYTKVMFIDSDFIVLQNIDNFFDYPQLSAAPNDKFMFNSGLMLLEPSECMFKTLMRKRYMLKSYNGGDQGYLNEVFTYWHRLSRKLNFMKFFLDDVLAGDRVVPKEQYAIHFFGVKPWSCYRDYDCNWDSKFYHTYASDDFHAKWWQVYDAMPKELQLYCRMTEKLDKRVRQWRAQARSEHLSNGRWTIRLKDPRQFNLVDS